MLQMLRGGYQSRGNVAHQSNSSSACFDHRNRALKRRESRKPALQRVPEVVLHRVWRECQTAITSDGSLCRILYSGRPASAGGPDFRDAVVEMPGGRRVYGDVEIHLDASGWSSHGHRTDGRYNGVTFHVTPVSDSVPVYTAAGLPIAALQIELGGSAESLLASSDSPRAVAPCEIVPHMPVSVAGDQRFFEKSGGFLVEMAETRPDQVLWSAAIGQTVATTA